MVTKKNCQKKKKARPLSRHYYAPKVTEPLSWLFAELFTLMSQHLLGLCLPDEVKCDITEGISGSHHTGM